MGYRSKVIITIEKELFENKGHVLKEFLKDCDSITIDDDEKTYFLQWTDVKWYDEYTKEIKDFLSEHNDKTSFVRLGDDYDDLETTGNFFETGVEITRDITCPEGTLVDLEKVFEPLSVKFMKKKPKAKAKGKKMGSQTSKPKFN